MPDRQLHTEQRLFITWTPENCVVLMYAQKTPVYFSGLFTPEGCRTDASETAAGTWTTAFPAGSARHFSTNRWAAGGPQPAPPTAALLPKGRGPSSAPRRCSARINTGPTDTKFVVRIRPWLVTCFSGTWSRGTRPMIYELLDSLWCVRYFDSVWITETCLAATL